MQIIKYIVFTFAHVHFYPAGSWFSSRFTGIHVPRIAEMLDTLQGKAHISGAILINSFSISESANQKKLLFSYPFWRTNVIKSFIGVPRFTSKKMCAFPCRNRYPQYHSSIQRILQKQSYQDNGCYSECE